MKRRRNTRRYNGTVRTLLCRTTGSLRLPGVGLPLAGTRRIEAPFEHRPVA